MVQDINEEIVEEEVSTEEVEDSISYRTRSKSTVTSSTSSYLPTNMVLYSLIYLLHILMKYR